MFKSIQPLYHRYLLLLLSVSLCVFITTACDDEDCDDEDNDICIHNPIPAFGTPSDESPTSSVTNPPNETTLPNPPNETTLPNPPAGEVNLVCGQIVRELDHPGAYNEPITFSNTAVATLVLLSLDTLDLVALTTQSGPFELPLDYCITGPASLLDTGATFAVFGGVNQEDDNAFNIGDLSISQRIYEENPLDIYGVTLPQYDAVTPLAGLEDCTADNSQFDCLIACDHPDIALYGCENECADNPSQAYCPSAGEQINEDTNTPAVSNNW